MHALVIMLMVGGIAVDVAVTPSGFAAIPATAVLLSAAHRLNARRRVTASRGGTR